MTRPTTTPATIRAGTQEMRGAQIRMVLAHGARLAAAWRDGPHERERDRMLWQRIARREIRERDTKMIDVAELMELQELKASRGYRGYAHLADDGTPIEIHTWEQYCTLVERRSVDAVDLDLANLRVFGTELYAALTQQGLGPATLRRWQAIPEDSHAALHAAAATSDAEQLVRLAGELLARAGQREAACGETPQSRAGI